MGSNSSRLTLGSLTVLLGMWITLFAGIPHPFHMAILEMEFMEGEQHYACALKVFSDDLELALRNEFEVGVLDIGGKDERKIADSLIQAYFIKHLPFQIAGNSPKPTWVGREGNLDAQWIYFTVSEREHWPVRVTSTLLHREFEDQRLIIHFKNGEDYRNEVLSADHKYVLWNE